ncbi:hypothetical protein OE88DRAFT_1733388 [Heliocybe sulcata]|uniref:WD40 repeat-like protein n=1 Tax=Heliocybe sulcata TaxID=5364 RepID=A0A5C3N9E5_9AGAM|nr:hypothetical protein OE88DRAFT_1733388 [Heliocybe sulcata]
MGNILSSRFGPRQIVLGGNESIWALGISPSSKFIASGGNDGVRLWDLDSYEEVDVPEEWGLRGPVSSLVWLEGESGETLVYGTALGFLACWRQDNTHFKELSALKVASGTEITCLTGNTATGRVAVGIRDWTVQVYALNTTGNLVQVFSVELVPNLVPMSIFFEDNVTKDVLLFSAYGGPRMTLAGNTGEVLSSSTPRIVMGHVGVSLNQRQYVLDNGINGFDIRDL